MHVREARDAGVGGAQVACGVARSNSGPAMEERGENRLKWSLQSGALEQRTSAMGRAARSRVLSNRERAGRRARVPVPALRVRARARACAHVCNMSARATTRHPMGGWVMWLHHGARTCPVLTKTA